MNELTTTKVRLFYSSLHKAQKGIGQIGLDWIGGGKAECFASDES